MLNRSPPPTIAYGAIRPVTGPRSARELTEIADKKIKQILETVKDVGDVGFVGDRRREIQLLLNADRLTAYGLTVDQVIDNSLVQELTDNGFIAGVEK